MTRVLTTVHNNGPITIEIGDILQTWNYEDGWQDAKKIGTIQFCECCIHLVSRYPRLYRIISRDRVTCVVMSKTG